MPTNLSYVSLFSKTLRTIAFLIFPLVLASLACNFGSKEDPALRETDIAIGIQQTLIAQTATALQAVLAAPSSTTPAEETSEGQPEATQLPSPTVVEIATATQPLLPTDTPTAEVTPTSSLPESIPIVDWGMQFWVPLSSGCRTKGAPCWKMDDDYKKHFGGSDLILVTKNPVLIDPSWPNPRLVFWHKYDLESLATVELKIDSKWSILKDLSKKTSSNQWVMDTIDLKDYRGKNIIVRFNSKGIWGSGGIPGSDWFVTEVSIIPDYQPVP